MTEASLFKGILCLLHPASQFSISSTSLSESNWPWLQHSLSCLSQRSHRQCSLSRWSSRLTRIDMSYDTAVYWIILLDEDRCLGSGTKTVISLRGRSILAAEAHQSHKLELLWNRDGASTGLPDIQVLETACKSAQAVVVWSHLLQRQQLCCFQWWIHSESKTALVVIRCTILG